MKKLLALLIMCVAAVAMMPCRAQSISSIETRGSWVYLYDASGRKYKTLAESTVGTVVGYSSSFFVATRGSWIYLFDASGRKYKTLAESTVGEVIGVAGDTFTSKKGSWIYTFDKNGKRISTRAAR